MTYHQRHTVGIYRTSGAQAHAHRQKATHGNGPHQITVGCKTERSNQRSSVSSSNGPWKPCTAPVTKKRGTSLATACDRSQQSRSLRDAGPTRPRRKHTDAPCVPVRRLYRNAQKGTSARSGVWRNSLTLPAPKGAPKGGTEGSPDWRKGTPSAIMRVVKHRATCEEANVKQERAFPRTRSKLSLVMVFLLTVLVIVAINGGDGGAAALRLFQSSPVTTPVEPTVPPQQPTTSPTAIPPTATTAGLPIWAIVVLALVVVAVVGIIAILLLRRR